MVVQYNYVVSPDFGPTVVPEGYVWDETAFAELVKATDTAAADEAIYTYGGAQGDTNVDYLNAADLTISNLKYDSGEAVDTTVTANAFNNTGTVTTDGAIVFSVQSFTNFGEFDLDKTGVLTATSAVMNMEDSTINLDAGSTLQGSTVGNSGTIALVGDHAAINGAITNTGLINAQMRNLSVTGDLQNGNEDATMEERDNSVITAREFEVTGNVLNYGVIGTEMQPDHEIDISGELRNYRQVIVSTLTAGSIYSDGIHSEVEEKRTLGYIIAGKIITGEINNVAGEISTGIAKEDGKGIDASGKINNGKIDAIYTATLEAGDNGWIQATDALNNIGEDSFIHAGYITVVQGTEEGNLTNDGTIQATSIVVDGSVTNSATGAIEVYATDTVAATISAQSTENNGTIVLLGEEVILTGDFVNNNLINIDGTVTAATLTNSEDATINLNAGSTLQGITIGNAGTVAVVSDHAAINGTITNNGAIDALMKKLTVTGDLQNANEHDTMVARDNSVITAREFEVSGNVLNYGVIGVESHPIHEMSVTGELNNYRQVMADILTAGSIHSDGIYTGVEERRTRGYIVAGEVNAGSIDNVSGIVKTSVDKETAVGINVTGTINNGNADNYFSTVNAGINGWIQAGSLNNIGTDIENSLIYGARITTGDIVNNGGISTRILESTGTITNNATGLIAVSYIDDPIVTLLHEAASLTAGTIVNSGTFAVYSEAALPTQVTVTSIENNGTFEFSGDGFTLTGNIINNAEGQIDVAGTMTGTGSITNSGTITVGGALTSGAISGAGTIRITSAGAVGPADPIAVTADVSGSVIDLEVVLADLTASSYQFVSGTIGQDVTLQVNGTVYADGAVIGDTDYILTTKGGTGLWIAVEVTNGPDNGWNDYVYDKKKTPQWSEAYTNDTFVKNPVSQAGAEIFLDEIGTIDFNNYHNYVGRKTADDVVTDDVADFCKISLATAASLKFTVDSTISGKYALYQVVDGTLKAVKSASKAVKAGDIAKSTMTKAVLLDAGDYYFGMTADKFAKNAPEINGFYNVYLTADSTFFALADNGWNDSAYVLDGQGKIDKTQLNPTLVEQKITLERGMDEIVLDNNVSGDYHNWVGFSDKTDYKMFHLNSAANLSFSLQATDKAKLTLWAVSKKGDNYTLTSKGTLSVKANELKTMKAKLVEDGDYFVSVESTNAKTSPGGDALYQVNIAADTVFFDSADYDLVNGWAYDKKEGINFDLKKTDFLTPGKSTTNVVLDFNEMTVQGFSNFVGHNDKVDYARFLMGSDGTVSFKVTATGAGTFTVYQLNEAKKKLEKLDTFKVVAGQPVSGKTLSLTAGSYFISMAAKDTNAKGNVFYNIEAETDLKGEVLASSSALAAIVPESAFDLPLQDSLDFGQSASALLAGSGLDPVSEKRFGEFANVLLASV